MTEPSTALKPSEFAALLPHLIEEQIPYILWGAPGIAKTSVVTQVCEKIRDESIPGYECRAWMRTSQMDPVDIRGLPKMNGGDTMSWQMPDWFPCDPNSHGHLFFDEITQGTPATMAGLMPVVHERRSGSRLLPPGWSVGAAANRETDRTATNRMPSALSRRFVHYHLIPDAPDFCKWALSSGSVLPEIVAFIRFRPELLHQFDPKLAVDPNPRAWEKCSRIVKRQLPPNLEYASLVGTVGEGAAIELVAFLRIWRSLPSIDGILLNPTTAPVPSEPSAKFAIAGALARRSTDRNFSAVLTYAERLGTELDVFTVKDAIARDPELQGTRAFVEWGVNHQEVLL